MKTGDFLNNTLNISEIFYSIQGEGTRAGLPCVFIRLQGCDLRCTWCDTPYALDIKQIEQIMTYQEILDQIKSFNCNFIEFTGGEPLVQPNSIDLMNYLSENNYTVAIETSGSKSIDKLNKNIIKILDIKCPGSKMEKFNKIENLKFLDKKDEIKFAISDRRDFDWAMDFVSRNNLFNITDNILFSPVLGQIEPIDLTQWILATHLPIRLQLQIHKIIWDPERRGV
ncbi:MAG TPA: radical SAM protein [Candidatus Kapabacteria bacterium]|nr:radical SAM protein [Candidatus Kapabacteria bacterium]